jgi:hypothetical protein
LEPNGNIPRRYEMTLIAVRGSNLTRNAEEVENLSGT